MGCAPSTPYVTDKQQRGTYSNQPPPHALKDDDLSSISEGDIDGEHETADGSGTMNRNSSRVNLTRERDQAVPTIEDELFVYDDATVVVNKDPDLKRRQRMAGRRPTQTSMMGAQKNGTAANAGEKDETKFHFNDFQVAIDEVEEMTKDESEAKQQFLEKPEYRVMKNFDIKTLLGHASRVKCIAITPNETQYVSCSNEDASVTLFDLKTGKELGIFTAHQDTVINATFSSDGKYLATTSRDNTMILWDVVTTKQILTFEHSKVVICCCFSKDTKHIATGCQDKVCRLWETRKGREVLIFAQHEGIIISMSYSPDNQYVVSASADKTLRMWSASTGKCRYVMTGHVGIVLSCQYSPDGKKIFSNDEKLLRVWNANEGNCTLSLNVESVSKIKMAPPAKKLTWTLSCAAPGQFTQYLIVACNNRFVYVLDSDTGEEVTNVFCKAPVYCLTSGFNSVFAFGDSFGNVYYVNLR